MIQRKGSTEEDVGAVEMVEDVREQDWGPEKVEPFNDKEVAEKEALEKQVVEPPVLESAEAWRQRLQAPSSFAGSETNLA